MKSSAPLLLLLSTCVGHALASNVVTPACAESARMCQFHLTIDYRYTMVLHEMNSGSAWQPVTAEEDGLYLKNAWDCSSRGPRLTEAEESEVITVDGSYRRVMAVNSSIPGPAIVAYHGQQLEISFTNRMINEATTIHFHGLHQKGTPWMDGVHQVSQCPINPGETFTYRLIAEPAGTFWYHAHLGDQYSMGIHGPLIVLDRTQEQANAKRGDDQLPVFNEEFTMMIQDWEETESTFVSLLAVHGFTAYSYGFNSNECYQPTLLADGTQSAVNHFVSGIINGRGWRYLYENGTCEPENPNMPLETFTVNTGGLYRFRLISASTVYGFRVSIDNHLINVITMDGHDVTTRTVEYLVVFPGERFDFYIEANDTESLGSYWIRVETLEYYDAAGNRMEASHFEGVLQYSDSDSEGTLPTSSDYVCTEDQPCEILNCPFRQIPASSHLDCVHFTELENPLPREELWKIEEGETLQEVFLNFGFWSVGEFGLAPGVNGINNILPAAPVQVYAEQADDLLIPCKCGPTEPCRCSNVVEIGLNNTVQLVLTSMPDMPLYVGTPHPVHIHGFTPQVVGVGWPIYDPDTDLAVYGTQDISSDGGLGINPYWVNSSWAGGNFPNMLGPAAPNKDTVVIPVGGYIIMRFIADNPGFWIMHCHTEYHGISGMAVVLKVGETQDMSPAPDRMRRCGDFALSDSEFNRAINKRKQYGGNAPSNATASKDEEKGT